MLSSRTLALREDLRSKLPDDFSRIVLDGSMRAAWDAANPIRANLFAAGLRELVGYLLHILSPDDDVARCPWYIDWKAEAERVARHHGGEFTGRPTRMHRMKYATQGGISDSALAEMGVDVLADHKTLRSIFDELSKYTHVRPSALIEGEAELHVFIDGAMEAVIRFLDTLKRVREAIEYAVAEEIGEVADEALTRTAIDELDELSNHTYVDEVLADDIKVVAIGPLEIEFLVKGTVYTQLNYGSRSDFNRGDGVTISSKFPFSVRMGAAIHDMKPYTIGRINVDNSRFYE